jgi:hypothetical protein
MHLITLIGLIIWAISFYLLGKYANLASIFFFGYMNYFIIGVGHNYIHQDGKFLRYIMNLTFFHH